MIFAISTVPVVATFGCHGPRYALGDYLEMASMGSLGGAAYQILLQSKLIITALMPLSEPRIN